MSEWSGIKYDPMLLLQIKKQQLEMDEQQQTGSRWERSTSRLYILTLLI